MITVTKRTPNEPPRLVIQRFSQQVRSGDVVRTVRARRFYKRKPNRRQRRASALVRAERRSVREWQKKRGLVE